jgi:threonine/homoserine/homoserine lactone efflux protein
LVSFIGSLQLGPVNLLVINSVLFDSKKTAYYIAIGGCIPEFIYCSLAVFSNNYLLNYDWLITSLKIVFIAILLTLGFVYYFKKKTDIAIKNKADVIQKPIQLIVKGFSLAAINPQLLPFWIFVQVYFNSIEFLQIKSNLHKFVFILGAGVGAFILLTFFVYIVLKYRQLILKYIGNKYYFKVLSFMFIAIAGHQIWLLMNS